MRWGIIGCGDVTEAKSGPAFQSVPRSELVAVMRRTPHLAEDYARRHGVERWTTDASEILLADDIDAVYIATHPDTHAEYTFRAAAAGKAVYVEKPMARTPEECRDMMAACATAGVPLWVAYYRRSLPRFEAVRKMIADGVIGDVRAVNSLRVQPFRAGAWQNRSELSGGGWFFDAACHTLDWIDWALGSLESVHGEATCFEGRDLEDAVTASYRLPGGVVGSGTWCFDADTDIDATTIVGSEGLLVVSISQARPIELIRGTDRRLVEIDDPPAVHAPLIQTIVDEWYGEGTSPSTGTSALRTAEVVATILHSPDHRPAT